MRREDRREQLLDSALKVIAARGYDAATITAVAEEAGVTRPVVYSIFPTIDDLLYALLERQANRLFTQLAENVAGARPGSDPLELWSRNLGSFLEAVVAEPDTWRLVLFPPPSTPPELLRRMEEAREHLLAFARQIVSWGLSTRGFTDADDVELASIFALQAFEESARLVLRDPERYTPARVTRFSKRFFAFAAQPNEV
jgi:AcrR family transcriptional regulator